MIAYNMTLGGLVEEQHFYLYVAPVGIAVALMLVEAFSSRRSIFVWAAASGLAVLMALNVACLFVNRTANDASYVALDAYIRTNYGPKTVVMSTIETWEMLSAVPFLVQDGVPLGQQAQADGSRLVVTSSTQINEGYGSVGPEIYAELKANGARVVWSQTGWSNGTMELWLLPTPSP
jgi:hypothetical protein